MAARSRTVDNLEKLYRDRTATTNKSILRLNPNDELPKVPVAIELAKTEEARKLIQAVIHDTAAITRPYALPPGTPKDRVQLLRRAFRETMKDKDFVAEAVKTKLDVDPLSGEQVEKIVAGLFKLDAATIAKMAEILK